MWETAEPFLREWIRGELGPEAYYADRIIDFVRAVKKIPDLIDRIDAFLSPSRRGPAGAAGARNRDRRAARVVGLCRPRVGSACGRDRRGAPLLVALADSADDDGPMHRGYKVAMALAGIVALANPARAELDLARASVERFPNGLTLIMLEDHSFPLVSTQMIYKSGSRDETAGKTGLAHFLEHLAFRASAGFPNGAVTEAIYDAGGEWHGYTWLDQTSYYSTMPREGLDLLLRIEADRMANVTIDPGAVEVEKGAVITEMHSYENDPASVLLDTLAATAILVHPYRNNTIGFESDVRSLTLEDLPGLL